MSKINKFLILFQLILVSAEWMFPLDQDESQMSMQQVDELIDGIDLPSVDETNAWTRHIRQVTTSTASHNNNNNQQVSPNTQRAINAHGIQPQARRLSPLRLMRQTDPNVINHMHPRPQSHAT